MCQASLVLGQPGGLTVQDRGSKLASYPQFVHVYGSFLILMSAMLCHTLDGVACTPRLPVGVP